MLAESFEFLNWRLVRSHRQWCLAREQFEQGRTQRVQVASRIDHVASFGLFGRHVVQGTEELPNGGEFTDRAIPSMEVDEAKVEQLDVSHAIEHDVGGFDIAMDDA